MATTFKWADGGTNPPATPQRYDRMNQYQIGGHAHPQPCNVFVLTPSVNNNFLRIKTHRVILPSHASVAWGSNGTLSGTNTAVWKLAGTTLSTHTKTGTGVQESDVDIGGAPSTDGDVLSLDVTAFNSGSVRMSATLWYFNALLARFRAGHPLKCLGFDIRGNCGASGTITISLYKTDSGGTKTLIKTLTGTGNGDFNFSDTGLTSTGEITSTDTLTVEVENIPPHTRHLAWNITVRPAYIDSPAFYTLGSGGGHPSTDKHDNQKRRVVTGIAPLEILAGSSLTTAVNNVLRMQARRHLLATCLEMGCDAQTGGTATYTLRPGAQTVSTAATGVQTAETVLAQTYAAGTNVLGVDLTAVGTGLARPSFAVLAIPYNEIAQFRIPFVGRILGFEVMGFTATGAPTGTLDATLRNKTTAVDIRRLNTATASSNSFEERDDALSAKNVAASDLLAVRIDAVPQGTVFLAWRITYTAAVQDA